MAPNVSTSISTRHGNIPFESPQCCSFLWQNTDETSVSSTFESTLGRARASEFLHSGLLPKHIKTSEWKQPSSARASAKART
ncbi:hypothetical protein TNCV_1271131 [Trichonephila clavipes]|nr:hypothetical protein TNCV_1271131 [Trichonephila clavipes]